MDCLDEYNIENEKKKKNGSTRKPTNQGRKERKSKTNWYMYSAEMLNFLLN